MTEVQLIIFSAVGSAAGGGLGAWLALRDRVMRIEHELWGVKGTNGLKGAVTQLTETVLAMVQTDRHTAQRAEARNKRQHPEEDE